MFGYHVLFVSVDNDYYTNIVISWQWLWNTFNDDITQDNNYGYSVILSLSSDEVSIYITVDQESFVFKIFMLI